MKQAQFDVEIPKRSELEEMPKSRKVRKVNGLAVCSIDIVGAAQADYDDPRLSDDEFKRKAAEESNAVHTHEGEPMKSCEVPIPERDIVGVKSGVVLDPVKVQVARQKGIDSIARHEVVELVMTSERTQVTHVGGWVEDNKFDTVRSRFVAKQVAYDQRNDVSQTTPALLIFRLLLSIAVSIAPIFCGSAVVLSVWDISVAFFHAVMDDLVCVHPLRDMVPPGWCWKLRKSMYGTKRASRLWADNVRRVVEDGSEAIAVFSMVFVNRSKRYIVAVWSDDVAFTVASEITELLEPNFECKLIGNIGPSVSLKVVKLLNRQLAWTEQGFEWHADTKHSRSVLLKHDLVEGKSTSAVSPGSKASGTNIRDGEDYLDENESKEYASAAGTLHCHALDRPYLQFTVGRLMSAITKPQRKHQAMMKHCLRYLVGRRCCAWKFDYQEWPGEIVILSVRTGRRTVSAGDPWIACISTTADT